jgi:hypothetical protein
MTCYVSTVPVLALAEDITATRSLDVALAHAMTIIALSEPDAQRKFTSGACHSVAVALYQAAGYTGKLQACLRESFDEDGTLFSTGYSHMVYEAPTGTMWDIGGSNADVRWEDSFDLADGPDEDGLTDRFRWEEVPYSCYQRWVTEHFGRIDNALTETLTGVARELLSQVTA